MRDFIGNKEKKKSFWIFRKNPGWSDCRARNFRRAYMQIRTQALLKSLVLTFYGRPCEIKRPIETWVTI